MRSLHLAFSLLSLLPPAAAAQHTHALDPGRYHIGDGAYTHTTDYGIVDAQILTGTHLSVPFRLDRSTTVAVRIEGLWGVGGLRNTPHNNWAFIDGQPVGRILPGARTPWVSAGRTMPAGRHEVLIVSYGPGDHDDFVLEGISVVTADPATALPSGPSRIWTQTDRANPTSTFGATTADLNAWIQMSAESWEERRREQVMEEQQLLLAAVDPNALPPEETMARSATEEARALAHAALYAGPVEMPDFDVSPSALRIEEIALEPEGEAHAGESDLTLRLRVRVDQIYVTRRTQARIVWRWRRGDDAIGGGPELLGPLGDRDVTLRWPLPTGPPASGRWDLEVTLIVGSHGATATLPVDAR